MFSYLKSWFKKEPEQDQPLVEENSQLATPLVKKDESMEDMPEEIVEMDKITEETKTAAAPNLEYKQETYRRTDRKD